MSKNKEENRLKDALKEIAALPDDESSVDEIMRFRWSAVKIAREALASCKKEHE